jgi:hypothetical protein
VSGILLLLAVVAVPLEIEQGAADSGHGVDQADVLVGVWHSEWTDYGGGWDFVFIQFCMFCISPYMVGRTLTQQRQSVTQL